MPALHRILSCLRRRSFPALRRQRVEIYWGGDEEELLFYRPQRGRHYICVHQDLRHAPRPVLEGGIAHELCHILRDLRLGRYSRELSWSRYAHSRWSRMREERAVEREAVALGYATHLLAFLRYARALGWSFTRENGLLYAELARFTAGRISAAGRGTLPRS